LFVANRRIAARCAAQHDRHLGLVGDKRQPIDRRSERLNRLDLAILARSGAELTNAGHYDKLLSIRLSQQMA
jgi:hypothetical protein